MPFSITATQLGKFATHLTDATSINNLTAAINQTLNRFDISNSPRRVRYFMAQAAFETGGFLHWEEDLTYTHADRIVAVWPSRFSMAENAPGMEYAPDFVNAADKLANFVYANRGGNGGVASEDGSAYKGRGAFGLTYRNNYSAASKFLYGDASVYLNAPDRVAGYTDGCLSAGWFWQTNNLGALADSDSFTQVTKVINGSVATVPQRLPVLNMANAAFTW